jgi:hypothetical protein
LNDYFIFFFFSRFFILFFPFIWSCLPLPCYSVVIQVLLSHSNGFYMGLEGERRLWALLASYLWRVPRMGRFSDSLTIITDRSHSSKTAVLVDPINTLTVKIYLPRVPRPREPHTTFLAPSILAIPQILSAKSDVVWYLGPTNTHSLFASSHFCLYFSTKVA